jgi:pentapeptide MXKDX repeat protein
MSKLFAAIFAAMFALGTVSVFAADDMKKDAPKKDEMKKDAKKDDKKAADKK